MNTNWKTNLGGAVSVLGTSLIGIGLVPQVAGAPSKFLTWLAVAGFVLSAFGKAITALFAADASSVKNVAAEVDRINALGSDPNSVPLAPSIPVKPNSPKP